MPTKTKAKKPTPPLETRYLVDVGFLRWHNPRVEQDIPSMVEAVQGYATAKTFVVPRGWGRDHVVSLSAAHKTAAEAWDLIAVIAHNEVAVAQHRIDQFKLLASRAIAAASQAAAAQPF